MFGAPGATWQETGLSCYDSRFGRESLKVSLTEPGFRLSTGSKQNENLGLRAAPLPSTGAVAQQQASASASDESESVCDQDLGIRLGMDDCTLEDEMVPSEQTAKVERQLERNHASAKRSRVQLATCVAYLGGEAWRLQRAAAGAADCH